MFQNLNNFVKLNISLLVEFINNIAIQIIEKKVFKYHIKSS